MLLTVAYDMMLNAGTQENPFELLLRSLAQVKVCGCVCACVCTGFCLDGKTRDDIMTGCGRRIVCPGLGIWKLLPDFF